MAAFKIGISWQSQEDVEAVESRGWTDPWSESWRMYKSYARKENREKATELLSGAYM